MNYYESHHTYSLLTIDRTLFYCRELLIYQGCGLYVRACMHVCVIIMTSRFEKKVSLKSTKLDS